MRMSSIYIRNVTKTFGDKVVFKNLTMEISEEQITCIMGPSGTGKTTLLRMLMGVEQADSGTIEGVFGHKLSVVFQEERLCEQLNAIDNIRLVNPIYTKQEVKQELARLGLSDSDQQPVSKLSGGMRRRVSILRALLAEYEVLFLDEPFQGLDNALKEQVIDYLKESVYKKTVVVVTHDIQEAKKLGDNFIYMCKDLHDTQTISKVKEGV